MNTSENNIIKQLTGAIQEKHLITFIYGDGLAPGDILRASTVSNVFTP